MTWEATFVRELKRAREAIGWSQSELAKRAAQAGLKGFHQPTIQRIEAGARPLRLNEALALARLVGRSLDDMIAVESPGTAMQYLELTAHHGDVFLADSVASLDQMTQSLGAISIDLSGALGTFKRHFPEGSSEFAPGVIEEDLGWAEQVLEDLHTTFEALTLAVNGMRARGIPRRRGADAS